MKTLHTFYMTQPLSKGEKFIWEWQYRRLGGFDSLIAQALAKADNSNLKRLKKAFPEYTKAMINFHTKDNWWADVESRAEDLKKARKGEL